MHEILEKYEAVIGLEVHAQLLTRSKAFSSDPYEYGADPNTQVSVVNLGHPGTLPRHNKKAVELAIRMGLAMGCKIREINRYARKNYFYADLPKGYQITQDDTPLCFDGQVTLKSSEGEKHIGIQRIHMEEDSGKSMHDQDVYHSLIDYNRAGAALIEIVTHPDFRSGEEAYQYLHIVRQWVRYLDICDGNMEEGSLRCDANISIRPRGSSTYGTKVEVKNMNSMRNVQKAIDFEIRRQAEALDAGQSLVSETRTFDALKGITISMRTKEEANDYRYFPEPDLLPLYVSPQWVEKIKDEMPEMPESLMIRLKNEFGLSEYDARFITENKETATYFFSLEKLTASPKNSVNWIMGPVQNYLNAQAQELSGFPLSPQKLADLISLVEKGLVSHTAAAGPIFDHLILHPDSNPEQVAKSLNLIQERDTNLLETYVDEVLQAYPDKVIEYHEGKKNLTGLFIGEVMKKSGGKADPKLTSELVRKKLDMLK